MAESLPRAARHVPEFSAGLSAAERAEPLHDTGPLARVIELRIPGSEPVSPELVLVDPDLARQERARLQEPGRFRPGPRRLSSSATETELVRRQAVAAVPEPVSGQPRPAPIPLPEAPSETRSPRSGRSSWLVAPGALALAVVGVLYWAQRDVSPVADDASPLTAEAPATAPPSPPTNRAKQSIGIGATTVRTLAWAPVAGAAGYEMQLYRGSQRVFAARTTRPRLTLPETWRYAGRVVRLAPGRYRWQVWPLRASGKRGGAAVVQAQILIAPR